jgi:macrodomain Ter protein organizer (MatP/YcbG family)
MQQIGGDAMKKSKATAVKSSAEAVGKRKATITLDAALWQRLRIASIEQHTSASEIINSLIAEHFERQRKGR